MAARAARAAESSSELKSSELQRKAENLRKDSVQSRAVTMGYHIASGTKINVFWCVSERRVKNHFDDVDLSKGSEVVKAAALMGLAYRQT